MTFPYYRSLLLRNERQGFTIKASPMTQGQRKIKELENKIKVESLKAKHMFGFFIIVKRINAFSSLRNAPYLYHFHTLLAIPNDLAIIDAYHLTPQ